MATLVWHSAASRKKEPRVERSRPRLRLAFQDKTALHFDLEPGITFYADYYNVKTGNVRVLKRWPPIPTQGLRIP